MQYVAIEVTTHSDITFRLYWQLYLLFVIVTVRLRPNVELYMRRTAPSRVKF